MCSDFFRGQLLPLGKNEEFADVKLIINGCDNPVGGEQAFASFNCGDCIFFLSLYRAMHVLLPPTAPSCMKENSAHSTIRIITRMSSSSVPMKTVKV